MEKETVQLVTTITGLCLVVVVGIMGLMWVLPQYGVWHQGMEGEAELAKAMYSKQVAVQTARAKNESARYEAEAAHRPYKMRKVLIGKEHNEHAHSH